MTMPPYFKQQKSTTCSLAVLRMVLASKGISVGEEELLKKVEKDYGKSFKNIWNSTIAKLACQFGIKAKLIVEWPLLKKDNLKKALQEYETNPKSFNYKKYENPNDKDALPEPLPLGYKETFEALKLGCKTECKRISEQKIKKLLDQGNLILFSIKLQNMYKDKKGYHSILVYGYKNNEVFYHDPSYGKELKLPLKKLIGASQDVGAAIAFS